MKNNLEKKIINQIYKFETKRIFIKTAIFLFFLAFAVFVAIFSSGLIYRVLFEKQTFDVLQIFQEDFEVVRLYFSDVISTFYNDIPKKALNIFLLSFIVILVLLFIFIRKYKTFSNRFRAILKHFFSKN